MSSLEKLLGMTSNLPTVKEVEKEYSKLRLVCSILYECKKSDIKEIKFKNSPNSDVSSFDIIFNDNVENSFYVKNSWEGSIVEAFGMALSNILLNTNYKFIISKDRKNKILVMTNLGEELRKIIKVHRQKNKENFFNEKLTISYGLALELANALYLGDRTSRNLVLTPDDNIVNIDFGFLFIKDYESPRNLLYPKDLFSPPQVIPSNTEILKKGRKLGRQIITKNIKENKNLIEKLFSTAIDRGFLEIMHKRWKGRSEKYVNYLKKYDNDIIKMFDQYVTSPS